MNLNDVVKAFQWRAAIKLFDKNKKVSQNDWDKLTEVLRLSPSSMGLQPWKFVVVKDAEIREKLRKAAHGQAQITDASHLVVLCVQKNITPQYIDEYIVNVAKTRAVEESSLADYKKMLLSSIAGKVADEIEQWSTKQIYIALGDLLSACALAGIDACPIEGFDHSQFDQILELDKYNIKSCVAAAVGYRSLEDKISKIKKVRFQKEKILIEL